MQRVRADLDAQLEVLYFQHICLLYCNAVAVLVVGVLRRGMAAGASGN